MKTSIINTDFWSDNDYYSLHLDSKILYMFLLSSPDRGYLSVFRWNKRFVPAYTGIADIQVDAAVQELTEAGFIEIYEGYISIKKAHVASVGGPYGAINTERDMKRLPESVRAYFYPDNVVVIEASPAKKPKKVGPAPETVKDIIARQPEGLRETLTNFVEDRKERKRPPTTRAVKGWINKLDKMYPHQVDKQVASLEQSIERGWTGLFEVKNNDRTSESREFM